MIYLTGAKMILADSTEVGQEIGRGRYGTVYKAQSKYGMTVAAKKFNSVSDNSKACMEFHNAVRQSVTCEHENILKIINTIPENENKDAWIIMEYAEYGDLAAFVKGYFTELGGLPTESKLKSQIAEGLKYLHDIQIVHRDIKPENIMVTKSNRNNEIILKIGDFGIAKFLEINKSTCSTNCGTLPYKAPEFWLKTRDDGLSYGKSVDIFSLGLTYLALHQAKEGEDLHPCIEDSDDDDVRRMNKNMSIANIMTNRHNYKQPELMVIRDRQNDSYKVKVLKQLIRDMTKFSPEQRPDINEVTDRLRQM